MTASTRSWLNSRFEFYIICLVCIAELALLISNCIVYDAIPRSSSHSTMACDVRRPRYQVAGRPFLSEEKSQRKEVAGELNHDFVSPEFFFISKHHLYIHFLLRSHLATLRLYINHSILFNNHFITLRSLLYLFSSWHTRKSLYSTASRFDLTGHCLFRPKAWLRRTGYVLSSLLKSEINIATSLDSKY